MFIIIMNEMRNIHFNVWYIKNIVRMEWKILINCNNMTIIKNNTVKYVSKNSKKNIGSLKNI